MNTNYKNTKTSFSLTLLSHILKNLPAKNRIGIPLLRFLPKLGFSSFVRINIGHYVFELEVNHEFHIYMIMGFTEKAFNPILKKILRQGDTFVDVGAEVGFISALAGNIIRKTGKMLVFEPDPRIFPRLKKHLEFTKGNDVPETIIFDKACSDYEGEVTMHLAPVFGQSYLHNQKLENKNNLVQIKTVTIDNVIKKEGIKNIRLLKMDVEGHEISALRGLKNALSEKMIDYIIIEKNTWRLDINYYSPYHLHSFLTHFGYRGAHWDGKSITKESLNRNALEDLIYARNEELLKHIYPEYTEDTSDSRFKPDEIEAYWNEAKEPKKPSIQEIQSIKLIVKAREGKIKEAIQEGEELLKNYPDFISFRGHLAHWYLSTGNLKKAKEHFLKIASENPDDKEVQAILNKMKNI